MNRIKSKHNLVSICIPSYNSANLLKECIYSILNSTYKQIEVIVSDDSSKSETEKIVRSLEDDRIRFFKNLTRLGVPANWNNALCRAKGDYVGLLNHDDVYGPFWVDLAVHILQKHPDVGTVVSAFRVIDQHDKCLLTQLNLGDNQIFDIPKAFYKAVTENGFGFGYITRRSLLEELNFYDLEAGPYADYDMIIRLASKQPVYYSNNPLHLGWRTHDYNLTKQYSSYDRARFMIQILTKTFKNNELPLELIVQKASCISFAESMINKWMDIARIKKDEKEFDQLASLKNSIPF